MRRTLAARADGKQALLSGRLVAVASAVLIVSGCGGGAQPPNESPAQEALSVDVPVGQPQQATPGLPPSYTSQAIHFADGPSSATPGLRVINSKGQFVADSGLVYGGTGDSLTAISQSPTYVPHGRASINEDGTVAGKADRILFDSDGVTPISIAEVAFVWRPSTGITELLANREGAGIRVFIGDNGDVGGQRGHFDAPSEIFHFSSGLTAPTFYGSTQDVEADYMNNIGTILAVFFVFPAEIQTISREGHFENILPAYAPDSSFRQPAFLDDDGRVYLDTQRGATVVDAGGTTLIGRGCVALPAECPGTNCSELTRFVSFASKGHAVGSDGFSYTDSAGPQFQSIAAFHWSPSAGTQRIDVSGASNPTAVAVNNAGVVVGNAGDGQAFVWSAATGGVRLQSLVRGLALGPSEFLQAIAVGDGGHILAGVCCGKQQPLVLLTPDAAPAP
jgi:hypothetical protein